MARTHLEVALATIVLLVAVTALTEGHGNAPTAPAAAPPRMDKNGAFELNKRISALKENVRNLRASLYRNKTLNAKFAKTALDHAYMAKYAYTLADSQSKDLPRLPFGVEAIESWRSTVTSVALLKDNNKTCYLTFAAPTSTSESFTYPTSYSENFFRSFFESRKGRNPIVLVGSHVAIQLYLQSRDKFLPFVAKQIKNKVCNELNTVGHHWGASMALYAAADLYRSPPEGLFDVVRKDGFLGVYQFGAAPSVVARDKTARVDGKDVVIARGGDFYAKKLDVIRLTNNRDIASFDAAKNKLSHASTDTYQIGAAKRCVKQERWRECTKRKTFYYGYKVDNDAQSATYDNYCIKCGSIDKYVKTLTHLAKIKLPKKKKSSPPAQAPTQVVTPAKL